MALVANEHAQREAATPQQGKGRILEREHPVAACRLGDRPLVYYQTNINGSTSADVSYLHVDQVNAPRVATNSTKGIGWTWYSDSWGTTPESAGTYHVRYPGQYYDQQDSNMQNWMRDYDPQTGRYLQSDPIGLGGGVNTYAYVQGNPISRIDPYGLVDGFVFGAVTPATPNPGLKAAADFAGLAGYDTKHGGGYTGGIAALGAEFSSAVNGVGWFNGVETTSSCPKPKNINLYEVSLGPEIPFVAGLGGGGGFYNTKDEVGLFFFIDGGIFGTTGSFGFGFSLWSK